MDPVSLDNPVTQEIKPVLRPSMGAILSRDFSPCGPDKIRIRLPVGIKDKGGRAIRDVWILPLNGWSELLSGRIGWDIGFIRWVSKLINNNVRLAGGFEGEYTANGLSVADRDMIILYLRMLTFGPEIWCIVQCPHEGCGAKLDLTFDLTELEIPSVKESRDVYTASIDYGSSKINFSYREPNGYDQEALSDLVHTEPFTALVELLSGCLVKLDGVQEITTGTLAGLPEEVLSGIDKTISEGMTSFDWDIGIICPECGGTFISTLDIQSFFWEELQFSKEDFWKETHNLAFYYHWAEAEIFSLSRWRRKMYLNHIRRHLQMSGNY